MGNPAGRPPRNETKAKAFTVYVRPETVAKIKAKAESKALAPGAYLDQVFGANGGEAEPGLQPSAPITFGPASVAVPPADQNVTWTSVTDEKGNHVEIKPPTYDLGLDKAAELYEKAIREADVSVPRGGVKIPAAGGALKHVWGGAHPTLGKRCTVCGGLKKVVEGTPCPGKKEGE